MKFKTILSLICLLAACFSFNAFADKVGKTSTATVTNATAVPFTPTETLTSSNVGSALNELDTKKLAKTAYSGWLQYFNTSGTELTVSSQSDGTNNLVIVNPTSTATSTSCFDNGGANDGHLRYVCSSTVATLITGSFSGIPATNDDQFVIALTVNDEAIGCRVLQTFTNTETVHFSCITYIAHNSEIGLSVGNMTAGRNITAKSLDIQAVTLPTF